VFEGDIASLQLLERYLDHTLSNSEVRILAPRFMMSSGEFNAEKTRSMLKGVVSYQPHKIVRYPFKPFDVRLAYLDSAIQPLFSRPSPDLLLQCNVPDNSFFITRDTADKSPEGSPFYFSRMICDYDCISGHARHFPTRLLPKKIKKTEAQTAFFDFNAQPVPISHYQPAPIWPHSASQIRIPKPLLPN